MVRESGKGKEDQLMENQIHPSLEDKDLLSESARAFLDVLLNTPLEDKKDIFTFEECENILADAMDKVDSANLESRTWQDKYANLRQQFQKVCAERDKLSVQNNDLARIRSDSQILLERNTALTKQVKDLQEEIARRDPRDPFKIWEDLYQSYRKYLDSKGVGILLKKVHIDITISIEGIGLLAQRLSRESASKWLSSSLKIKLFKHNN
jgi:polyhydroxyalkanoate synthesis regulator phasin